MPTHAQLLDAAATILVVVAAHLRLDLRNTRRHKVVDAKLRACARRLDELAKTVDRWSGLP